MHDRCLLHRLLNRRTEHCRRCGFQRRLALARQEWQVAVPPADGEADALARVRAALRESPRPLPQLSLAQLILRMNRMALLFTVAGLAAGLYLLYDSSAGGGFTQLAEVNSGSVWSIP